MFTAPPSHDWLMGFSMALGLPYPPTPALDKARAAPGTTAGVELFFVPNALHFPRATQALCSPPRSHSGHSNFCALPTSHSCHSNLCFYGETQQAAADPVQFQQVPETVAVKRFKAAVCQPSKLAKTTQTLPCSSQVDCCTQIDGRFALSSRCCSQVHCKMGTGKQNKGHNSKRKWSLSLSLSLPDHPQ